MSVTGIPGCLKPWPSKKYQDIRTEFRTQVDTREMRVRREGPRKYLTQYSVCHENGKIPKPTLKCLCVVAHWEGRDSDLWGSLASQLSLVDDS